MVVHYMSCVSLSVSAGVSFENSNYDNWNTNTNVSSHLCYVSNKNICRANPATGQKINFTYKGVGRAIEGDF